MIVVGIHTLSNSQAAWDLNAGAAPTILPDGVSLRHVFVSVDGTKTVTIWSSPEIATVGKFLLNAFGGSSTDEFFETENDSGIEIPRDLDLKSKPKQNPSTHGGILDV